MNPFGQLSAGASNVFAGYTSWVTSPSVDVSYKALLFVFILVIFGMIPATRKFATWAAAIILFTLLVANKGSNNA